MPAPIFSLPISGSDPKLTAKELLDAEVNRVVGIVFDQANPEDRDSAEASAAAAAISAGEASSDAASATTHAENAATSASQAQLAASAAGAPLYLTQADGIAGGADGDMFLVYSNSGIDVYTRNGAAADYEGSLADRPYKTVSALVNSTEKPRGTGAIWKAGGFRYEELVAGTSSDLIHLTNSAGVLFKMLPTSSGHYVFEQINPAKDGVTDDLPKLQKMLTTLSDPPSWYPSGPTIEFPTGNYFFSQTINLKSKVQFLGGGAGLGSGANTKFIFPDGVLGIVVNRYNTIDDTTELTPTGGADGSLIKGIACVGTITGTTIFAPLAHGIWLRARARVENCTFNNFGGNGIHIAAAAGAGGSAEGNANLWRLDTVSCNKNGLSGVFVDGPDVNAGYGEAVNCKDNARHGIYDSSFLGNTWVGCHVALNGCAGRNDLNGAEKSSYVHFGGVRYVAHPSATEAALVATEPGTDAAIWHAASVAGPTWACPTWESGKPVGTYFVAFAYHTDNANARNLLLGCYNELGAAGSWLATPTVSVGGSMLDVYSGVHLENWKGQLRTVGIVAGGPRTIVETQSNPLRSEALSFYLRSEPYGNKWGFDISDDDVLSLTGGIGKPTAFSIDGGGGLMPRKGVFHVGGYLLGPNAQRAGYITKSTSNALGTYDPTSGDWARGDVFYGSRVIAGGHRGVVCVTSGTAGSTAVFKKFGEIEA